VTDAKERDPVAKRPRTLKSKHLRDLVFLSDPHLAADGARAFCVRTRIDTPDERPPSYRPEIVEVPLAEGGEPRVVAGGDGGADHPRLSPDGRWLAFLAKPTGGRRARKQARLLDLAHGGESRALTDLDGGVERVVWRPDGAALLLIGRESAPPDDAAQVEARVVERLHAKQDGLPVPGLRPEEPTGLWFASVPDGKLRRLEAPRDGVDDVAWDPDGRTVWLLGPAGIEEGDAWRSSLWRTKLSSAARRAGGSSASRRA
jgi:dipeptidyl aminopeptidase/acylaminoacyl peptidase